MLNKSKCQIHCDRSKAFEILDTWVNSSRLRFSSVSTRFVFLHKRFEGDILRCAKLTGTNTVHPKKTRAYLYCCHVRVSWKNKSYQNSVRQVEIDRAGPIRLSCFHRSVRCHSIGALDESLGFSNTSRERHSDSKTPYYK